MPLRIVVANEPRIYREVLAGALTAQRPAFAVALVDPEQLDAALAETRPDVVIATVATPALQAYPGLAFLLYAPDGSQVVLRKGGQVVHALEQADFTDILSLIDQYAHYPGAIVMPLR